MMALKNKRYARYICRGRVSRPAKRTLAFSLPLNPPVDADASPTPFDKGVKDEIHRIYLAVAPVRIPSHWA